MYFSFRMETQPRPPSPARTSISAWSMNMRGLLGRSGHRRDADAHAGGRPGVWATRGPAGLGLAAIAGKVDIVCHGPVFRVGGQHGAERAEGVGGVGEF